MRIRSIAHGWIAMWLAAAPALGEGDSARGARAFGACAACHSMEPERHLTGPSLAGLWGRKAGAAPGFARFSPALKNSGIVWNESSLDAWLANPEKAVPGNYMQFRGIAEGRVRADLVAYLRAVAEGKSPPARGAAALPDLKAVPATSTVTLPAAALEPRDLLDPLHAFRLSAVALDARSAQVEFRIAEGYYLYRDRFRFETADGKLIAEAELPQGRMKQDPFFGRSEIYRHRVRIRVPLDGADLARERVRLKVVSQGCSDAGVCYIPQEQWVEVSLGGLR